MIGSAWSLVPFLIVIPISMWTKQVVPALAIGLLTGAYMVHPSIVGGLHATVEYLIRETAMPDNVRLILFLYGFGALVGLVRVSGGIAGFANWLETKVKSTRAAYVATWISGLGTFMAPDFRIITVAPIMKTIFARLGVPTERMAVMIDITATPLTAVVPIGTAFVGYMVGLLAVANRHHTVVASPFRLFLESIPWNLFAWASLLGALVYTFLPHRKEMAEVSVVTETEHRTVPVMEKPLRLRYRMETAAEWHGDGVNANVPPARSSSKSNDMEFVDPVEQVAERAPARTSHLLVPLILLLTLTLIFTWWSGHQHVPGFWGALAAADAAVAMLEALVVTLIVTVVLYSLRRLSMERTMFGFMAGGNDMMGVIVLLGLVWGVTAVSSDLGFVTFTEREVSRLVPAAFIAPTIFVAGCVISYVIGSSFGAWGMLLPIGFSLAASTHASIPLVVGAVFASGTFGGFASPLSDNTVAMATVMKLPVLQYAKTKLKVAVPTAGLCTAAYAVAGWLTA